VDVVSDMLDSCKYDLSDLCRNTHVTKVAFVPEAAEQIVTGYSITVVPYRIFDIADAAISVPTCPSRRIWSQAGNSARYTVWQSDYGSFTRSTCQIKTEAFECSHLQR
jgi:hypothetical protein